LFAETQYLVTELNNHRARLMLDQGNFAAARDILEPSRELAMNREMGNMSSGRVPMIAELHRLLGMTYEGLREFALAEEAYRIGLNTLPQAAAAHPIEATFMEALLTNSLAVLYNQTGRGEQALETYIEVSQLLDKLLIEHPQRVDFNGLAATVAFNLGNHYSRGRNWTESERHYRKAQQSFAKLHAASPLDSLVLRSTAEVTGMLASSLAHLERFDEARGHFEAALALIDKSTDPQLVRDVRLRHTNNFARMLAEDLGQPDQARALFSQVVEEHASLVDAADTEQLARSLAFACKSLGELVKRTHPDDVGSAKTWHEQQLKFAQIVMSKNRADELSKRDVALALGSLAQCALDGREFTAAGDYAEQIAGIDVNLPDMAYRAGREHAKLYLRMRQDESLGATESQLQQTLQRVTEQLRNARTLQHERLDELLSKDPVWRELPESVVVAASN
jgi:tetratricopeptide (TPR) repeat protein